jgi:hypothetical protein
MHLAKRRGHPTWEAFRAWQAAQLAKWRPCPQQTEATEVWHHLTFAGRELVSMTYPTFELDNVSQPS